MKYALIVSWLLFTTYAVAQGVLPFTGSPVVSHSSKVLAHLDDDELAAIKGVCK